MEIDPQMVGLGVRVTESMARNTASSVADRIRTVKARKREAETIAELEEIVYELVADKAELIQLAQAYEEQFVAQQISDDDINYITTNIIPVVTRLAEAGRTEGDQDDAREQIELLTSLVSVETVTVLQLLGFNFKQAVGEPLTELVARLIASKAPLHKDTHLRAMTASLERDAAQMQLARDAQAVKRYRSLHPEE